MRGLLRRDDDHENDDADQSEGVQRDVDPIAFFNRVDVFGDPVGDFVDEQFRVGGDAGRDGGSLTIRDSVDEYHAVFVVITVKEIERQRINSGFCDAMCDGEENKNKTIKQTETTEDLR